MVDTIQTIKFSEMTDGGDIANNERTPGLESGANVLFNNPWTFLAPGSTGDRPPITADIYYRLRLNTTLESYEYYSPIVGDWVQLQDSIDVQSFPFVIYKAEPLLPDAFDLGTLNDGLLKQTVTTGVATLANAINGTDYYGPGYTGYLQSPAGFKDINGNILFNFGVLVPSAVNYLTIVNAISGAGPAITAKGADADIALTLYSKGSNGYLLLASDSNNAIQISSGLPRKTTTLVFANTITPNTVTFPDSSGTLAYLTDIPSVVPAALTRTNDTNVTLTLGGTPATSLLQGVSLTLGWTGQLAPSRGGTGISALGTGVATALGQNVSGSGGIALTTSPSFVTPVLGVASATSLSFGGSVLSTYNNQIAWTPTITFATPGDLSVTYSFQLGLYTIIGGVCFYRFALTFTPTFTTASGTLRIQGIGLSCLTLANLACNAVGSVGTLPTYPAGTTQLIAQITSGNNYFIISGVGSGTSSIPISTTQCTSGLAHTIAGSGFFYL